MPIERKAFFTTDDGQKAELFVLSSESIKVSITNCGGSLVSVEAPDRDGNMADVVLGHDNPATYLPNPNCLGCLVGRFANRIADGRFTLEGKEYQLAVNNGPNHLHGGPHGYGRLIWDVVEAVETAEGPRLVLEHFSPDGEEAYPGNLKATATFTLRGTALHLDFTAETDAATIVNFTWHPYFNLAGHKAKDCLDHEITIHAKHYLPVNENMIPTGEIRPVEGSAHDLTSPARIGDCVSRKEEEQIKLLNGIDHNYVLDKKPGEFALAAVARDPHSGRCLKVYSDQPGIQFYTGSYLNGTLEAKSGGTYTEYGGFCLEPQKYPDSPNQPEFPSVTLRPGETYTHASVFDFTVEN